MAASPRTVSSSLPGLRRARVMPSLEKTTGARVQTTFLPSSTRPEMMPTRISLPTGCAMDARPSPFIRAATTKSTAPEPFCETTILPTFARSTRRKRTDFRSDHDVDSRDRNHDGRGIASGDGELGAGNDTHPAVEVVFDRGRQTPGV